MEQLRRLADVSSDEFRTRSRELPPRSLAAMGFFGVLALLPGAAASLSAQEVQPPEAAMTELGREGLRVDTDAFTVLPKERRVAQLSYFSEVLRRVRALEGARQPTRSRWVLENHREDRENFDQKRASEGLYPTHAAVARLDGREPLPLIVIPTRSALDAYLMARAELIESPEAAGKPWVSTLFFARGPLETREFFACPMPAPDLHGPVRNPKLKGYVQVGLTGRISGQEDTLARARRVLGSEGRDLQARLDVVAAAPSLYLVRWTAGEEAGQTWAVPVADANGAARRQRPVVDGDGRTWFRNDLQTRLAAPEVAGCSLQVLPRPMPLGSESIEVWRRPRAEWSDHRLQERFVLTREMLRGVPLVAVRPAREWKPFMEDAVLTGIDAEDALADVRAVAISLDAQPEALISLAGRLFGVDALKAAREDGWLAELRRLRPE